MAYIPENAKWYLADVIIEIRIEAEPRSLVHINTVLVRADSPEEAHNKSLELGQQQAHCYENTDAKLVTGVFRGLGEVTVIHDDLEHGAELIFKERVGLSEEQILALVRAKDQLGVFAPREPSVGPNYMPRAVMDALRQEGYEKSDVQDSGA